MLIPNVPGLFGKLPELLRFVPARLRRPAIDLGGTAALLGRLTAVLRFFARAFGVLRVIDWLIASTRHGRLSLAEYGAANWLSVRLSTPPMCSLGQPSRSSPAIVVIRRVCEANGDGRNHRARVWTRRTCVSRHYISERRHRAGCGAAARDCGPRALHLVVADRRRRRHRGRSRITRRRHSQEGLTPSRSESCPRSE